MSNNQIQQIQGLVTLKHLTLLDVSYNQISHFEDIAALAINQKITFLSIYGNPLQQKQNYQINVKMILPKVVKLDEKDMVKLSMFQQKYSQAFLMNQSQTPQSQQPQEQTVQTPESVKQILVEEDYPKEDQSKYSTQTLTPLPKNIQNSNTPKQFEMKRSNSFKNTLEFMQQVEERIKTPVPAQLFIPQSLTQYPVSNFNVSETNKQDLQNDIDEQDRPKQFQPRRTQQSFQGDPISAMSIKPIARSQSKSSCKSYRDTTPTQKTPLKKMQYDISQKQSQMQNIGNEDSMQQTTQLDEIHSISTFSRCGGTLITNQSPRQEWSFVDNRRQQSQRNVNQIPESQKPKIIKVALGTKNKKV